MPPKRKKSNSKKSTVLVFTAFITIAVITVCLLEYIDFSNGKPSFLFTKIVHLKKMGNVDKIDTSIDSRLLAMLNHEKIKYDYFKDSQQQYHIKLETAEATHKALLEKIKGILPKYNLKLVTTEVRKLSDRIIYLYNLQKDRQITHIILVTIIRESQSLQIKETQPAKKIPRKPRIAFIIDDIGNNDFGALELKKLDIPITASILPFSPYAFDEARQVYMYNIEALIHLPMQPLNSHSIDYTVDRFITRQSSESDIRALLEAARQTIPYAKGTNNHQGSLITSDKQKMVMVLKVLKSEGLFFIDSRTTPRTVAFQTAKAMNIKTAERDVFLEDIGNGDTTYEYTLNQITRLIQKAKKNGKAIAIGHPFQTTFRAVHDSIPRIREEGVEIVFASSLLE